MKKQILSITKLLAFLGIVSLFFSCNVGLGNSVDTAVPTLTIINPPVNAIVRGTFGLTGTWSDDGEIKSIEVTVSGVESDVSYSYTVNAGDAKALKGDWKCAVDPKSSTKPLPDGPYEITVVISDVAGHQSKKTRNITIDNTPPVVIVERPGTGIALAANIGDLDSYGQIINLKGKSADDNNVDHIDVSFYPDESCTGEPLNTVTLKNVPPTIDLTVATYSSGEENDYSKIYGSVHVEDDKDKATMTRYCKIVSYDSAQAYPADGSAQSSDDKKGNSTEVFYLNDEASKVFVYPSGESSEDKNDYSATDIYHFFNGAAVDEYSVLEKVEAIKTYVSAFTMNPQNNPTFKAIGKDALKLDGKDFDTSVTNDYVIFNGSTIDIEVTAGLDGTELKSDTLALVAYECDSNGNIKAGAEKITLKAAGTAVRKDSTNCEWTGVLISNSVGLSIGKSYIFKVEGEDMNGNSVLPHARQYGFLLQTKGSITGDIDSIKINGGAESVNAGVIYVPAKNPSNPSANTSIAIQGNMVMFEGNPEVFVYIGDTQIYHKVLTDANKDNTYVSEDDTKKYKFSTTISTANFPNADENGERTLKVTVSDGSLEKTIEKIFVYDCVYPEVTDFVITPTASKYDLAQNQTAAVGTNYLNGTVNLKLCVQDEGSQIKTAKIEFFKGSETVAFRTENPTEGFANLSYTIDTTQVSTNTETKLKIKVTAVDYSGNETVENFDYNVDQTTDIPAVLSKDLSIVDLYKFAGAAGKTKISDTNNNPDQINFVKHNGVLPVMIFDDDGIDTVTTTIYRDEDGSVANDPKPVSGNKKTEMDYSITLPYAVGIYKVEVSVKDIGGKTYNLPYFYARVISDKPVLNITKDKSAVTTNTVNVTDSKVNSVTTTIGISSTQKPFVVKRVIKDSDENEIAAYEKTYKNTTELNKDNPTVKDTINMTTALASGVYTVSYTVTDSTGSASDISIALNVDNTAPVVSSVVVPTAVQSAEGSFTFSGEAVDYTAEGQTYQSNVKQIQYTFDTLKAVENIKTAGGTTDWLANADFSTWSEGQYTIFVRAIDTVGNIGEWKAENFWYDKSVPTATISAFVENDGVSQNPLLQIDNNQFYYGYSFSLKGTAYDSNEIKTVTLIQTDASGKDIEINIPKASISDNIWTVNNLPRKSVGSTDIAADAQGKLVAGTYKYKLKVVDVSDKEKISGIQLFTVDNSKPTLKQIDSPAASAVLSGSSSEFSATAGTDEGSGIEYLYYAIDTNSDVSDSTEYTKVEASANTQWKTVMVLGTGLSGDEADLYEGHYYLHVYVEDKAKNISDVATTEFFVDQSAPVLSASATHYVNKANNKTTVSGTVTESNALKSLVLYRNGSVVKTYTIGSDVSVTPADAAWSFTDTFTVGSNDGEYTYSIKAIDIANREKTADVKVIVDTVSPTVNVENIIVPTAIETEEKSFKFTGSAGSVLDTNTAASPSSGFDKIDFIITTANTAPAATGYVPHFTVTPGEIGTENSGKWTSLQTYADTKYASVFNTQGTKYLWAKVYDKAGNTSAWTSKSFVYDTETPVIKETTIGFDNIYQTKTFTIGGTVSDSFGVKSVTLVSNDENNTSYPVTLNAGKTTWSSTITLGAAESLKDGDYIFTATVTDNSDKIGITTRTIRIDTSAPNIESVTTDGLTPYETINLVDWYKTKTIKFGVTPVISGKGSGIDSISYSTVSASAGTDRNWSDLTKTSSGMYTGSVTFEDDGVNTIYFRIKDKAGNVTGEDIDYKTYTFNIDSVAPADMVVYSDAEGNNAISGEFVVPQSSKTYYVSVSDSGTGVEGVYLGSTFPAKGSTEYSKVVTAKTGNYYVLNIATPVTGPVNISVKDKAGNTATYKAFSLKVDNKAPVIVIESPVLASGSTTTTDGINGNITISGYITDGIISTNDGMVMSIKFEYSVDGNNWYQFDDDDTIDEGLTNSKETFSITHKFSSATQMADIIGGKIALKADSTAESKPVYLKITATDQAGNKGTATRTLNIDRNSDRPVINFSSLNFETTSGLMSKDNYVWLKNTTKLIGTVTDDDGISSMQISMDGSSYKDVDVSKNSWNYDLVNFFSGTDKEKETAANSSHILYFKVVDTENNTYTSSTTAGLSSIRIRGKDNVQFGTKGEDTLLYVTVDTLPPSVSLTGGHFGTTGAYSTAYSSMILGGDQNIMMFKFTAEDDNGIGSTEAAAVFTWSEAGVAGTQTHKVAGVTEASKDSGDAAGTYVATFTLDLQNKDAALVNKEGVLTVTLTGKDRAENSSSTSADLTFDYKKPVITVTKPASDQTSSGSVNAYGSVNENVRLYYALSPSSTVSPYDTKAVADADTTGRNAATVWSGKNPETDVPVTNQKLRKDNADFKYKPVYKEVVDPGLAWFLYFDGNNSEDNHDMLLNTFLTESGVASYNDIFLADNKFDTLVNVYLWLKAVDESGNIGETNSMILVDPQGERPTVTISYPSVKDTTLGGTINVYGTAEPKRDYSMQYVWLQLIPDYYTAGINKSSFNATADSDITNVSVNDLNYLTCAGYDLYNMKTYNNSNHKNQAKWTTSSTLSSYNYTGYTATASDFAILIPTNGSTGWSKKINTKGEFNNSDRAVNVTIRVYAEDNEHHISIKQEQAVQFDAGNPVINNIYMRQYDGSGNVTASKEYSDNMYLSGIWYLTADISDSDKITTVNLTGDISKAVVTAGTTETYALKEAVTPSTGVGRKAFDIEVTDSTGVHKTTKTIIVNYDNNKPVLAASTAKEYNIDTSVCQNNGFYTLGSKVSEDSVGTVSQSGLDFVAFYYTSNKTTTKLYDVMMAKGNANATVTVSGTPAADGLYWTKATVDTSKTTTNSFTITASNPNVHRGGLVKIGGVIYYITGVSDKTITIKGNLDENLRNTYTTASFAMANVVNNTTEESEGITKVTNIGYGNGYYSDAANDDGDLMLEKVTSEGIWEARINSKNIPDGPVTLHYVAYDKAGNYTVGTPVSCYVSNNGPRLAGVTIYTDYNGDGLFTEADETITAYNAAAMSDENVTDDSDEDNLVYDPDEKSVMTGRKNPLKNTMTLGSDSEVIATFKGYTKIEPEIVGGNGKIFYNSSLTGNGAKELVTAGTTDYTVNTIANPIEISVANLVNAGNKTNEALTYTFYDSTYGGTTLDTTAGHNQTATLTMHVAYNAIAGAPSAVIKPFYWNSYADNSVYGSDSNTTFRNIKGHIETEESWAKSDGYAKYSLKTANYTSGEYDEDPKVSGEVVIKGTAHDDVRIEKLYFSFSVGNTEVLLGSTGAANITNNSAKYYCLAAPDTGKTIIKSLTTDTQSVNYYEQYGIKLELENTYTKTGHDIEWKLIWNTNKVTNNAQKDLKVRVIAQNAGTQNGANYKYNTSNGALATALDDTQTTEANPTPRYRVDVVPYILNLSTKLTRKDATNPSKYGRTALGKYPVYYYNKNAKGDTGVGETYIKEGFNLGSNVSTTIANNTASDNITHAVNSVNSLNNVNDNTAEFNKMPNGVNNDLLTDDVAIVVWYLNAQAAASSNGNLKNGVMKVNPNDGNLGFAYIHNGDRTYNLNGTDSTAATSTYVNSMFTFDRSGNAFGTYGGTDFEGAKNAAARFKLASSLWGAPDGDGDTGRTAAFENLAYYGEDGSPINGSARFGRTSIAASTLTNSLYMMYYDNTRNELKFLAGNGYNATTKTFGDFLNITSNTIPASSDYTKISVVANSTTDETSGYGPGKYCAIAVKSNATYTNDVVVAIWYDESGSTLWYSTLANPCVNSHKNSANQNVTTNVANNRWTTPVAILDGNAGAGACAIGVDADGHVHIAAYSSDNFGSLVYAYLESTDATATPPTVVTVDSQGSAGEYLSLDFAKSAAGGRTVPYIGYFNTSAQLPKYAYLVDTADADTTKNGWQPKAGADSNMKYTGAWEEILLPTDSYLTTNEELGGNFQVSIGVYKTVTTDVLKTTWKSGPASTATGTATNNLNPVLGYGIKYLPANKGYMETAQLR